MNNVLVIASENQQRHALASALLGIGATCEFYTDLHNCLTRIENQPQQDFTAIVIDVSLPIAHIDSFIAKTSKKAPLIPVYILGEKQALIEIAQNIKGRVEDYISFPINEFRLKLTIANARKIFQLKSELDYLKRRIGFRFSFSELLPSSSSMQKLFEQAKKASAEGAPIVIEGEDGVKKRELAKSIHELRGRGLRPFVTINCAALRSSDVDEVLQGFLKTESDQPRGKLMQADGGTLFLDGVSELNPLAQKRILHILETGTYQPLDAKEPIPLDIRIISSTECDLQELVRKGKFREDLYYRLNIQPLRLPALRDRRKEIASEARHIASLFSMEDGLREIEEIEPEVIELLTGYDWPGNDRELERVIYQALALNTGAKLSLDDFPKLHKSSQKQESSHKQEQASALDQANEHADQPLAQTTDSSLYGFTPLAENQSLKTIAELERHAIKFAIEYHRGHMTRVAESLGIGRSTLYRKIAEYGLDESEHENGSS